MKDNPAVPLVDEPALMPARRRRRVKPGRLATPYVLLLPALVVIVACSDIRSTGSSRSRSRSTEFLELIAHEGQWIGLDNYPEILGDR